MKIVKALCCKRKANNTNISKYKIIQSEIIQNSSKNMMTLQNKIVSFQNHMNKCFDENKKCPGRYMLIFKAPYLNTES